MNETSDKMLDVMLIQRYADLERIISADDSKKEAEYQLNVVKEKLYHIGFDLSKLAILDRK